MIVSCRKKDIVFIYSGPGVSKESLEQTSAAFSNVSINYRVESIIPQQVIEDEWEEKAVLFVLPGGSDLPYVKFLNGKGNKKLRNYVEAGGAFLGICAGSYYAGNYVDFAKGSAIEVRGERELALFPGTVRGPLLCDYVYGSHQGARAAKIYSTFGDKDEYTVFYNGGGYFEIPAGNTHVLATYDRDKAYPAIIECSYGKGVVILSGVHIEYDFQRLDSTDACLKNIIPMLEEGNSKRLFLLRDLLQRLIRH